MPGHIGTSIVINSMQALTDGKDASELANMMGGDADGLTSNQVQSMMDEAGRGFRDDAPTTSEQAAAIILDGVRAERWRILVGEDAYRLDEAVRANPEDAYEADFAPSEG